VAVAVALGGAAGLAARWRRRECGVVAAAAAIVGREERKGRVLGLGRLRGAEMGKGTGSIGRGRGRGRGGVTCQNRGVGAAY